MSIFSVGGNAGFGFGPLLAVFLITTFGMKGTAFYGFTAIIMSSLLFLAAPSIRRAAEASRIASQQDRPVGSSAVSPQQNDWAAFGRLFLVIVFRSTAFTAISSFLPLFCIQSLGATPAIGSATLSIISIVGVLATLVGGWLADRKGYVHTLRYGCCLLVPCLAVVAFAHNIWAVFAMLIPMSFAMQGPYAAFVVLGQSYLAKSVGFASGVTLGLSFSMGGIIVPSLGWYADHFGINAVMVLILIIAACCAAATFLLPQPKRS
jgi:FSR family fosmidomycin resistance protein-like MFS transporter